MYLLNIINIPSLADLEGLSFSTCGSAGRLTGGCVGLICNGLGFTGGGLGFTGGGLGLLGDSWDWIGCGWPSVDVDGNCGLTTQIDER